MYGKTLTGRTKLGTLWCVCFHLGQNYLPDFSQIKNWNGLWLDIEFPLPKHVLKHVLQ